LRGLGLGGTSQRALGGGTGGGPHGGDAYTGVAIGPEPIGGYPAANPGPPGILDASGCCGIATGPCCPIGVAMGAALGPPMFGVPLMGTPVIGVCPPGAPGAGMAYAAGAACAGWPQGRWPGAASGVSPLRDAGFGGLPGAAGAGIWLPI
jgi:hypothetical protein